MFPVSGRNEALNSSVLMGGLGGTPLLLKLVFKVQRVNDMVDIPPPLGNEKKEVTT